MIRKLLIRDDSIEINIVSIVNKQIFLSMVSIIVENFTFIDIRAEYYASLYKMGKSARDGHKLQECKIL